MTYIQGLQEAVEDALSFCRIWKKWHNFRSLGTVVDRLGLLDFTVRPALDNFGRSELDAYFCKMISFVHVSSSPLHVIVVAGVVTEIIDVLFLDVSELICFNEAGAENICGRLCILAVE